MRMTELPMLEEIRDEYVQLRRDGNNRAEATEQLIHNYGAEITLGADDDGLLFWIGLADAQYHRKELTEEAAQKALEALDRLEQFDWDVSKGDIERRRKHYLMAPMTEKKVGKPRPKYRCDWNVGDTFAYKVGGEKAERLGISGKYFLLRMVSECMKFDGKLLPVVTVTFWDKDRLPENAEEFNSVPVMKIEAGGRCNSPKGKFEYRTLIIIDNRKQLENASLKYIGNFGVESLPEDEIIFTIGHQMTLTLINTLDEDCCIYWKADQFYTYGIDFD